MLGMSEENIVEAEVVAAESVTTISKPAQKPVAVVPNVQQDQTTQPSDQPSSDQAASPVHKEATTETAPDNGTLSDNTKQTALVKEQLKYCATVLKGLKRHPQSGPFQVPVDPVALNIPDYFDVIKSPMDLSTVTRKLESSEYPTADHFVTDVRLMLTNCFAYNHPESQVTKMGKALEKYFNTAVSKMPTELAVAQEKRKDAVSTAASVPRARRESQPTRRMSVNASGTPRSRSRPSQNPDTAFCGSVLRELLKKTHQSIAWPFLEPVDPAKLGIPDYFDVIKQPMDLSTIKRKLEAGKYQTAEQFEFDIRLIIKNCYLYNAPESDVVNLCRAFERLFESKWAQRPTSYLPSASSNDDFESDSEKILEINRKIQALQQELNGLLMRKRSRSVPGVANSAAPRPRKPSSSTKPKTASSTAALAVTEEEFLSKPMSFDEKRQLSIEVNNLAPERLGRVVEIIQSGMPRLEAQGDSEVIELDIESLDVRTLRELQRYVMGCKGVNSLAIILESGGNSSAAVAAAKRKKSSAAAGPTSKKPVVDASTGAALPNSTAAPSISSAAAAAAQVMSSDDESSDEDLD